VADPLSGAAAAGEEAFLMAGLDTLEAVSQAFARVCGVEWGDVYLRRSAVRDLYFCDGKIEEITSGNSAGCSARLLNGRHTAVAAFSGIEHGSVARAWNEAFLMAGVSAPALPGGEFPLARPDVYFPDDWSFCYEVDAKLRKECPWITQVMMSCISSARNTGIASAEYYGTCEERLCSFGLSVVLEHDGRIESGYSSWRRHGDAADFFAALDVDRLARKALKRALRSLEAEECPTGGMPVVLSERAGGTMIHEACGHGMEADLVFEERSCFAGMLGKQVAAEGVTIVDDATLPGRMGSFVRDDEGTLAQRTVLIENGILKNYMTDRRSALLYSLPLTGNGRRSSYSVEPLPRMTNTFVVPGDSCQEEMIAGVKNGLFVEGMGGGEVNTTTGEFVFEVTEGSLIENGRVTRPVRGASLIGTGIEALKGIRAVGKNLYLDSGICEKEGQSVPVTDGQPSLLIEGLTVGGTATK